MFHPAITLSGHPLTAFRAAAVEVRCTSGAHDVTFNALKKRWFISRYSTTGAAEETKQSGYVDSVFSVILPIILTVSLSMHRNRPHTEMKNYPTEPFRTSLHRQTIPPCLVTRCHWLLAVTGHRCHIYRTRKLANN